MFFKRPSFKYGGQAEGIKQTVRKNFNAGTNPNRTGSAFVQDSLKSNIFESQAPTNFNVMNQGIAKGLQMRPNAAISAGGMDTTFLNNLLKKSKTVPASETGDASIAEQIALETTPKIEKQRVTSADVQSGKAEPPGLGGFKFKRPIQKEDFLGDTSKKLIEENKLKRKEEAQAFIDKRAEQKNVAEFDTSKVPNQNLIDTEKSAKDDFEAADNLAAKNLSLNPNNILDENEKQSALTGKDIPMYEKFLGPKEAEIKRKAYLAAAKFGVRLINMDAPAAIEAGIVDAEKLLKEKSDLTRIASLKGLEFEKDMMIQQMKLDAAALRKDPTKLEQTIQFYTRQYKKIYGNKISDAEARSAAESFVGTYGGSMTKGFIDAAKENAAILARNAGLPDAIGKDAQIFNKVGYAIATDARNKLNAANMFAIPTKMVKDKETKKKEPQPDFNDFAFVPNAYYYNQDGDIFQYVGDTTITTQETYNKAKEENKFIFYSPTTPVNPT